jgi:ankyrin repeat protein
MSMKHETTPQKHQVGANPAKNNALSLPPHLIGVSLYMVAERGDVEAVRALLNTRVDIDAEGEEPYGNPLQIASYKGHEGMVRLLLEKGVDVNAQGGHYGNALQAASRHHKSAVVALLVEYGAKRREEL